MQIDKKNQKKVCKNGIIIMILVALVGTGVFGKKIYDKCLDARDFIGGIYNGLESELDDKERCFLCGNNERSLIKYYHKFGSIGLISLNDWYVLDLKTITYDGDEKDGRKISGMYTRGCNTGAMSYTSNNVSNMEKTTMDIFLPERYRLETELIQSNLCQVCLNKVVDSLEYNEYKNPQPIPLCLIDFQTFEIYSLQDWHVAYTIRDFDVTIDYEKNDIKINVCYG